MSYERISIGREGGKFEVRATDPEIRKKNNERKSGDCCSPSEWQDPEVKYSFDTKEQVLAFVDKAIDIALPEDAFTSTFDKLAKEAQKS